ncbi:MAG: sigma-70 family RNA polymerase sigma factor [Elusimicrobia bacterium]|nr:sigma-70 family RNA polymerase sigma factor [Elusimicrobiota bacterium]
MTQLLVIDDEDDYCYLVRRILEPAGFTIHTTPDGASGWAALQETAWDGLILDINLPDQDGYAFCRQVRSAASPRYVPILFLTVRRRPEEWIQGFDAGADDYLTKPIIPEELLARVQALVDQNPTRQVPPAWPRPEDGVVSAAQHGNRAAFEALLTHHRPRVFQFFLSRLSNPDSAEDLTAQTFAAVYQALPRFRRQAAFATWLYRIATNMLCHHVRKAHHAEVSWEGLMDKDGDPDRIPQAIQPVDSTTSTPTATLQRLCTQEVLATLPVVYQQVLQLYEVEHLDYPAIARKLGRPMGTVMSRLHRARRLFRRRWHEGQDGPAPARLKIT